jgi:hypothetical protein
MTTAVARAVTLAGWSAAAALLAHGGPALLIDPRWLAVALAGSLTAAAGLTVTGARALDRAASARSVARGDFSRSRADGFRRAPMGALFAAMLVCQGAAHIALALGGVHAAAGTTGALALHGALAALGALLVYCMEGVLERLTGRLEEVVRQAIARMAAAAPALHPRADWLPVPALAPAAVRPRGPPADR